MINRYINEKGRLVPLFGEDPGWIVGMWACEPRDDLGHHAPHFEVGLFWREHGISCPLRVLLGFDSPSEASRWMQRVRRFSTGLAPRKPGESDEAENVFLSWLVGQGFRPLNRRIWTLPRRKAA